MTEKDYALYGTKVLNLKTQEIGLLICIWKNKFADSEIDSATCVDKQGNLRYLHMPKSIDEVCLSKYYPRIYKPLVEAFPNYTNPKILSQPLFLSYIWFLYFEELLQYLL